MSGTCDIFASFVDSGVDEDGGTVDELRLSAFEDRAIVVDAEEVGASDVVKRYSKGVYPHSMRFDRILVRWR